MPSPASVGSTASTSSSGGGATSHTADSTITLPRHIFNKAADHLAISALINTCLELWRLSDSYMEQCRGEHVLYVLHNASLFPSLQSFFLMQIGKLV